MTSERSLDGQVAVVTGGSRGLGYEIALAAARAGASVVVASRKLDACQAAVDRIEVDTGQRGLAVACHVGKWDELDALVETTYDRYGRADVLVNNAGMSPLYPSLTEVTEALFDKVIDVNLKSAFRLSATFGERMKAAGRGSIINVSSVAAVMPTPIELPYAAAKAGLNNITVGFAKALGPQVRVNCVMAGPFLTDVSKAWDLDAFAARAEERYALQRAGDPSEITGAVMYFATDASSFTTGTVLTVDGGVSIPNV